MHDVLFVLATHHLIAFICVCCRNNCGYGAVSSLPATPVFSRHKLSPGHGKMAVSTQSTLV